MANRSNPLTSSDYLRHSFMMPLSEMDRSRIQNVRIDLTEADVDDWRDAVLFGTGPLGAYTPGPDAPPSAIPASAAPPPIAWRDRAPSRAVQAVKVGLTALAVVFAVALLGGWLA